MSRADTLAHAAAQIEGLDLPALMDWLVARRWGYKIGTSIAADGHRYYTAACWQQDKRGGKKAYSNTSHLDALQEAYAAAVWMRVVAGRRAGQA